MSLKNIDKRIVWGLGAIGCLALVVLLGFFFQRAEISKPKRFSQEPIQPYSIITVENVQVPVWYQAVGVIDSEKKATVSAQISGVVTAFSAEVGDDVYKGEPVVELIAEELEARAAKASSQLLGAQTQEEIAQSHFNRTVELYRSDAATRVQYEQAQQRISDAKAMAAATKETLREANVKLEYRLAKAPFDGVVAKRFVDPGDLAWPGKPLFSIYDPNTAQIEVMIPESYVEKLKVGLETIVEIQSIGQQLQAKVVEIRPHVDPNTRAFVSKANLSGVVNSLYPGMFGSLRFQTGERNVILIPKKAVITHGQLHLVWVKTEKGWKKRYVTLGSDDEGGQVEVLSGLSTEEKIAVMGKG